MMTQKKQLLVGICVLSGLLLAAPAEGQAACALLDWLSGGSNAQTTYAPPYAAPVAYVPAAAATSGCAPCAAQTVQYVQQTYYRAAYVAVPVTAYRPTVTADPCTGCAVTAYRPVTAMTYQTRLVPYTSYRAVYANPCTPCASYASSPCSTCGPARYVSPSSSCGSCASAPSTAPYTDQPVISGDRTPTLSPQPTILTPKPDGSSSTPDTVRPRTFDDDRGTPKPADRYRDLPARPERPALSPTSAAPEFDPEGRTTQRILPTVTPVGMATPLLPLEPVKKPAVIEAPWQPAIN